MKSHSVEHRFFDNIWGWIPRDAELAWRSLMGEVLRSSGLPAADVAKSRPAAFSNRRTNHREKEINRHARSLSFAPGGARAFEDGERPRCRPCCGLENPVAQSVELHLHKNTLSVATAFARRVLASLGRLQDRATALAARTLSRRSPMLRANEFLAVPLPSAARASGTGEIQLARLAGNAGSAVPLLRATPATLHAGPPFAKKASSHWPVSSHARACSFSLRSKCLMRA